jgi:hypothetical protein
MHARCATLQMVIIILSAFAAPFSVLAFLPKFFFGSLLTFIAINLMYEYLILSRKIVVSLFYYLPSHWGNLVTTRCAECGWLSLTCI